MLGRFLALLASAALASEVSIGAAAALQAPVQLAPTLAASSASAAADGVTAAAKKKKKKIPAISVSSDTATTVRVQIQPKLTGKKTWKFTVQRPKTVKKKATKTKKARTVVKWVKVKNYKTVAPDQTRVVALLPGTYRIYTPKQNKYSKTYTPAFAFPLPVPAPAPTPGTNTGTGSATTNSTTNTTNTTTGGSTAGGTGTGSGTGGTGGGTGTGGTTTPTATAPSPPQNVTVTPGSGSVLVTWAPPANDGGSRVTAYVAYTAGLVCYAWPPFTSCTFENLANGTSYRFYVVAQNAVGYSSPAGVGGSVTPAAAPTAPSGVTGTPQQDGTSMVVSWSPPASSGGSPISAYTVTSSPAVAAPGGTCQTTGATTCKVSGLTTGVAYSFIVVATNAAGQSDPSVPSGAVSPALPPGTPSNVTAVKGAGKATVSWTAPSGNGATITRYTVTPYVSGAAQTPRVVTGSPAAASLEVTGLTNGTAYTFTVTATNQWGWSSEASAPSNLVTPLTVPSAPLTISANALDPGQITVSWGLPPSNGGTIITGYEVVANLPGFGCTSSPATPGGTPPRTCTVAGLTAGNPIQFHVRSVNSEGTSTWSPWSASVEPL